MQASPGFIASSSAPRSSKARLLRCAARVAVVAGALLLPVAVAGPAGAAAGHSGGKTLSVICHGGGSSCSAVVNVAGGASNKKLRIALSDTDLKLVGIVAKPGFIHGAYILSGVLLARRLALHGHPERRPVDSQGVDSDPPVRRPRAGPRVRERDHRNLSPGGRKARLQAGGRHLQLPAGKRRRQHVAAALQRPRAGRVLLGQQRALQLQARPDAAPEHAVRRRRYARQVLRGHRALSAVRDGTASRGTAWPKHYDERRTGAYPSEAGSERLGLSLWDSKPGILARPGPVGRARGRGRRVPARRGGRPPARQPNRTSVWRSAPAASRLVPV